MTDHILFPLFYAGLQCGLRRTPADDFIKENI
jgi:hypothetical protein